LSTLFNDPNPNPIFATFDRLIVALGAEQEFTLVPFIDNAVAQVIAVGVAEVQAVKQAPPIRHLHAVPEPASVFTALRRQFCDAEAEVAAAARDAVAATMKAELRERIAELHEINVALESTCSPSPVMTSGEKRRRLPPEANVHEGRRRGCGRSVEAAVWYG